MLIKNKELNNMNIEKQNAVELIKLALIFARNNSNDFFKSNLMKHTTYQQHELDNLTDNYVNYEKISLQRES